MKQLSALFLCLLSLTGLYAQSDYVPVSAAGLRTFAVEVKNLRDVKKLRQLEKKDIRITDILCASHVGIRELAAGKSALGDLETLHFRFPCWPADSLPRKLAGVKKLVLEGYQDSLLSKCLWLQHFTGELVFVNCSFKQVEAVQLHASELTCISCSIPYLSQLAKADKGLKVLTICHKIGQLLPVIGPVPGVQTRISLTENYIPDDFFAAAFDYRFNETNSDLMLEQNLSEQDGKLPHWLDSVIVAMGYSSEALPEISSQQNDIKKMAAQKMEAVSNSILNQSGSAKGSETTTEVELYTNKPELVFLKSGAILNVEPGTFCDSAGNPVSEVQLRITEYNNPYEMMMGNVPMTAMVGGQPVILESNTMFDIQAFSKGKALKIAEGKEIKLFPKTAPRTDDSLYTMGHGGSTWQLATGANLSQSLPVYPLDTATLLASVDLTSFDDRYEDLNYWFLLDQKSKKEYRTAASNKNYVKRNASSNLLYVKLGKGDKYSTEQVIKRKQKTIALLRHYYTDSLRKKNVYFELESLKRSQVFPELQSYNSYWFRYTGPETKREFAAKMRGIKIHDIRIIWEPGNTDGVVELKTQKGFIPLPFSIGEEYSTAADIRSRLRNFSRRYTRYLEQLNYKRRAFNRHNQLKKEMALNMSNIGLGTLPYAGINTIGMCNIDRVMAAYKNMKLARLQWKDSADESKYIRASLFFEKVNTCVTFHPMADFYITEGSNKKLILTDKNGQFWECDMDFNGKDKVTGELLVTAENMKLADVQKLMETVLSFTRNR